MALSANDIWALGQNDPIAIADAILYSRLTEAIAWCSKACAEKATDPRLRSPELQPRLLHSGPDDTICGVGSTRHWLVRETTVAPITSLPNLAGGRLLSYFPDADLCDGAAEEESGGFFDVFNTPPWDTWVGFFHDGFEPKGSYDRYLLAFVPQEFVQAAGEGIAVNPEECIAWLEDTEVRIKTRFSIS